jgi:hypothetical protein
MVVLTTGIHHTIFYEGVAAKSIGKIKEGAILFSLFSHGGIKESIFSRSTASVEISKPQVMSWVLSETRILRMAASCQVQGQWYYAYVHICVRVEDDDLGSSFCRQDMICTTTDKDKVLQSSSKCTIGRLNIHPKLLPGFEAIRRLKKPERG